MLISFHSFESWFLTEHTVKTLRQVFYIQAPKGSSLPSMQKVCSKDGRLHYIRTVISIFVWILVLIINRFFFCDRQLNLWLIILFLTNLAQDHHCIWINNCVGYWNYKAFFTLVLYATLGSIYSTVCLIKFTGLTFIYFL